MNILLIGNGGREHALAWKIHQSPLLNKLYCIPGSPGIEEFAESVNVDGDDLKGMLDFALKNDIGLTVIGPEIPLVNGVVDLFEQNGLKAFGPSQRAARIEGSKIYMKKLLRKHNIPTAEFVAFNDYKAALLHIESVGAPLVIKTDGLAAGKGAYVCKTLEEAEKAIQETMIDKVHGESGSNIIIEDFMPGEEASLFVFTDGHNIYPLESAQDHKPIFDDDKGPNTGGMGAYSPAPILTENLLNDVLERIIVPTVHAMNSDDSTYKGLLYAGLMMTPKGPKVVEFNCRFGDPEAQPVLMRMKTDIVPVLLSCCNNNLHRQMIEWHPESAVCVVMSSEGYPGSYSKNKTITGLDKNYEKGVVFHSGIRKSGEQYLTNGGRVLGVTGMGANLEEAISNTYDIVDHLSFDGAYYRKDIGSKGLGK
ncbi:MAG: phosphoribosylamine--glycine ligase [Planctomycetota bacterium]|nr:MAG: phosphoribosylamine--glycine ligase [Planctomycetota bacterium]